MSPIPTTPTEIAAGQAIVAVVTHDSQLMDTAMRGLNCITAEECFDVMVMWVKALKEAADICDVEIDVSVAPDWATGDGTPVDESEVPPEDAFVAHMVEALFRDNQPVAMLTLMNFVEAAEGNAEMVSKGFLLVLKFCGEAARLLFEQTHRIALGQRTMEDAIRIAMGGPPEPWLN